jgi:hypothetical protein
LKKHRFGFVFLQIMPIFALDFLQNLQYLGLEKWQKIT